MEDINFQACCRLCLSETAQLLKPIFNDVMLDRSLLRKIQDNLTIKIQSSDKLSTMICAECEQTVIKWQEYKHRCIQNQCKLRRCLRKALTAEHNQATHNLSDLNIRIKEEPMDHDENSTLIASSHEGAVQIKSEPVDPDDEYGDFPSALIPQIHMGRRSNINGVTADEAERRCPTCEKLFTSPTARKKHEKQAHPQYEPYTRKPMTELPKPSPKVSEEDESQTSKQTDVTESAGPLESNEPTQPDETIESTEPTEATESSETEKVKAPEDAEPPETTEASDPADEQKILFAAGLKLVEKNSTPISCEALSKIELSYIEKCKAMVHMHKTLECACHNVTHPNLKGLLSHLRSLRIWFPVFTCYNCMITFTDRSTFTKHNLKCPNTSLDTLTKLSNTRKRSEMKTRLYQNFRCTRCKFMFSFHEDYMKHVDEEHCTEIEVLPVKCTCDTVYESLEDYKDHIYMSCMVEFYCDICFITRGTLEEFQKHAVESHDDSEGFILLQDDGYKRKPSLPTPPSKIVDESAIVTGKRERRAPKSLDATPDIMDSKEDKVPNPYAFGTPRSTAKTCPICAKEYSSNFNMMRHFKSHTDEEIKHYEETSVYACPDCEEMFKLPEWRQHLADKHEPIGCEECGKLFQFKSELEQHRSVHLNIKVYRDSKTQSLKTAMVSPGSEQPLLMCEICEEIFHGKEELKNHKLTHLQNGVGGGGGFEDVVQQPEAKTWTCTPCDKIYTTYSGLWDHNKRKHSGEPKITVYPKECKHCGKVLQNGAAYGRHKLIHEKERAPSDATTKMSMYMRGHKESSPAEEESYHTCGKCFKVFSSRYNLKNHMKCHGQGGTSKSKFACSICQQMFETDDMLNEHMQEHAEDPMMFLETEIKQEADDDMVFTCDVCAASFTAKEDLTKHREIHIQTPRPAAQCYCKYCKIGFDSVMSLTRHMHTEHAETAKPKTMKLKEVNPTRSHACTICGKSFHTAGALSTHVGWHRRGQNDTNTKVSKVIKQVAKETPKPSFVRKPPVPAGSRCGTCHAVFPNETALQVHILEKHRSVSSVTLVQRCNVCSKDFKSQEEFDKHKKFHEFLERQKAAEQQQAAGKNFPCRYCNAGFSRSDTLGTHMRQYHKEYVQTEFKCVYCERVFDKQNSLSIHLKTHEKQRLVHVAPKASFSCSICNMGFSMPKDLRAHTISAHPF